MAIGVTKMARLNAIVRQLPSVETLGSVQVICSDKTGTLTEGKMGTAEIWTSDNSLYTFTESTSLDPTKGFAQKYTTASISSVLSSIDKEKLRFNTDVITDVQVKDAPASLIISSMIASLCNNSNVVQQEDGSFKPIGDPTEVAMVVAAQKAGFSREFFHQTVGLERICEFPFDSERKLMSCIYKQNESTSSTSFPTDSAFIIAKGAPEGILSRSTHYLPEQSNNSSFINLVQESHTPMNANFQEVVSQASSRMAESGLRVLALAIRNVSLKEAKEISASKKDALSETNLTFVALIGLIDPPKYFNLI